MPISPADWDEINERNKEANAEHEARIREGFAALMAEIQADPASVEHEDYVEMLRGVLPVAKRLLESWGPCQHDAGICTCGTRIAISLVEAALEDQDRIDAFHAPRAATT